MKIAIVGFGNMGKMIDRRHRELTDEDIDEITKTYHAWRGEKNSGKYKDVKGFCKSAKLEEVEKLAYERCPAVFALTEKVSLSTSLEA